MDTRQVRLRAATDPFTGRPREFMVQYWYPAVDAWRHPRARYVSPRVGEVLDSADGMGISDPGRFAAVRPHARRGARPAPHRGGFPLVLFSHGSGSYGASGTTLCEDLASHGYLVAAVDHTFDSEAVEFPVGRLVRNDRSAGWPEDEEPRRLDELRAGDLRSTLDDLCGRPARPGNPLRGRVDRHRIGAFGHSRGGAAVSAAMGTPTRRATPRISAGLGLDAPISELVASRGLDDAFMLLTSEFLKQGGEDGPFGRHWRIFRENHRGWGRHLKLVTSGHWTFMDPTPLFDFLGTRNHLSEEDILRAFGPPELRRRAVGITRAYVRAFFDHHLRRQQAPILDEPAPEYPEIEFRWRAR